MLGFNLAGEENVKGVGSDGGELERVALGGWESGDTGAGHLEFSKILLSSDGFSLLVSQRIGPR